MNCACKCEENARLLTLRLRIFKRNLEKFVRSRLFHNLLVTNPQCTLNYKMTIKQSLETFLITKGNKNFTAELCTLIRFARKCAVRIYKTINVVKSRDFIEMITNLSAVKNSK